MVRAMAAALPDGVRLDAGNGGLERLVIDRPEARAELYLHGATLTSWQPAGRAPVLWRSKSSSFRSDKAIRGGIPICFPWFGPSRTDPRAPQHGFARLSAWSLESARLCDPDRAVEVVLGLGPGDTTRALWPHRFSARYTARISAKLELELQVTNEGETKLDFEEALHTYFAVKDVRAVSVRGLENSAYADKTRAGAITRQSAQPLRIGGETDRTYNGTTAACELEDPGFARRISVQKDSSKTTIVWNPWMAKARALTDFGDDEWPEMICIESGNTGPDAITLEPGASHGMRVQIVVNEL